MNKKDTRKFIFSKNSIPLLLAFLAISVFTLGLFVLNSYTNYKRELDRASTDNKILALALEQYIDTQFKSADLALGEVMTLLPFLQGHNSVELSKTLKNINAHFPGLETISISNDQGKIIANTIWNDDVDQHLNIMDRQYFIDHKNNPSVQLIVSDPILSRVTGNQIVMLCRKLPSQNGKFRGIVLASINLKKLIEAFSEIGIGSPNMLLALINNKRLILARYPYIPSQIGKYIAASPAMVTFIKKGLKEGSFESLSPIDTETRVFNFKKLENFPLTVVVGKSKSDILGRWRNFTITTGLIGLLFSLFIFFPIAKYFKNLSEYEKQKILLFNSAKMTSLGIMASGIAHKINNPLAIISGKSFQIIRMANEGKHNTEEIKKHALKINETSFRIAKIVEELKLLSVDTKLENEKNVSVSSLIKNASSLFTDRMKKNKINFSCEIIDDVTINCRESQLIQVILGLVNESFNAIEDQEIAWINLKVIKTSAKTVQISISDNGARVSEGLFDEVMAPFLSSDSLQHDAGLTLRISKSIVEDHNGRLFLDSYSHNTNFVIELPC